MNVEDAKSAMEQVWSRWGTHIPRELRRYKADDIFRFHSSQSTFDSAFHLTFETTFKKANGLTCPAEAIGAGCGAFVTPTQSHEARLIHIHPRNLTQEFDPMALFSHEYIHFLSHPSFYPAYYKVGGQNPFRVEGATEWLTLESYSSGFDLNALHAQDPAFTNRTTWHLVADSVGRPITYVAEYQKTKAWLQADRNNLKRLLDFVFRGIGTNLGAIHP